LMNFSSQYRSLEPSSPQGRLVYSFSRRLLTGRIRSVFQLRLVGLRLRRLLLLCSVQRLNRRCRRSVSCERYAAKPACHTGSCATQCSSWRVVARAETQQDWFLKSLQGGRAHPLAVCGVATLCWCPSSTGAAGSRNHPFNLTDLSARLAPVRGCSSPDAAPYTPSASDSDRCSCPRSYRSPPPCADRCTLPSPVAAPTSRPACRLNERCLVASTHRLRRPLAYRPRRLAVGLGASLSLRSAETGPQGGMRKQGGITAHAQPTLKTVPHGPAFMNLQKPHVSSSSSSSATCNRVSPALRSGPAVAMPHSKP
jgi:hypothetical protein